MAARTLTHRQRLEYCLSGDMVDRVPVALWRHFPVDDQSPDGLAAATAAFQKSFDFDFIKVTPASSFCIADWGIADRWTGNPEGTRDYTDRPIHNPEDWDNLHELNPNRGHLGDQLTCLRLLLTEFSPHIPVIQTIFSPMAQAKNLIGKDRLSTFLRLFPDALHYGLEIITKTTINFIETLVKIGIDGIFFANQHAQYSQLSVAEFLNFGKAYDLRVLNAAERLWLNIAHIHGENIMFEQVIDYPVAVLNWHDRLTPPALPDSQKLFPGVVCGGLRQWETMVLGTPRQVQDEAMEAIESTGGIKFILGTGCVLPITAPYGNIMAARRSVMAKESTWPEVII